MATEVATTLLWEEAIGFIEDCFIPDATDFKEVETSIIKLGLIHEITKELVDKARGLWLKEIRTRQ